MATLNALQSLNYSPFLYSKDGYQFSCRYCRTVAGTNRWGVSVEKNGTLIAKDGFEDMSPKRLQKYLVEKYVEGGAVTQAPAPTNPPEPAPAPAKGRGRPAARGRAANCIVGVRFTDREMDLLLRACQPGESVGQMLRRVALTP